MIKFIAALDNKRGIANEHGIPWQGKIPGDVQYYHENISTADILMGYGVYKELTKPYAGHTNYVAVDDPNLPVSEGFERISDARAFLQQTRGDIWNAGGAMLFASTLDLADELYLTLIGADFNCTKFFPEYEDAFEKVSESEPRTENGLTYRFTVWKRK